MSVFLIVWIVSGLFNLAFYFYQCVKDGEIKASDIFLSVFILMLGIVGSIFIVIFLLIDQNNIDKIIWKRKKDVE